MGGNVEASWIGKLYIESTLSTNGIKDGVDGMGNKVDHQQQQEEGGITKVEVRKCQNWSISRNLSTREILNLDTLKWNWTHLSMSGPLNRTPMCRRLSLAVSTGDATDSHKHRDDSMQITREDKTSAWRDM